jgi:hypothetical protein
MIVKSETQLLVPFAAPEVDVGTLVPLGSELRGDR